MQHDGDANDFEGLRSFTDGPNTTDITALNLALANVWFAWATRGVFLGIRRQFVQVHVEAWFMSTQASGRDERLRAGGADVDYAVAYQQVRVRVYMHACVYVLRSVWHRDCVNGAGPTFCML